MNVVFLGESTEEKRFLMLCLAKIASCHTDITILSKNANAFDEISDSYEYCGVDFVLLKDGENFLSKISETASNFVDAEEYTEVPDGFKVISISEATRSKLESCINITSEYALSQPSLRFYIIYLNIMEYCKIGKQFLNSFWEHNLPTFTEIVGTEDIYFEEKNHIVMIESQYTNRLSIKSLSIPIRAVLRNIIQYIFSLDVKEAKAVLKRAERMK